MSALKSSAEYSYQNDEVALPPKSSGFSQKGHGQVKRKKSPVSLFLDNS